MSKRIFYLRYSLIIKRLQKAPASFAEISQFLTKEAELQDFSIEITKRTFQRDLDEIRTLFNVDIQYDFSRKVYAISEESQNDTNHRMLEAFEMFNALNIADDLSNYVYFENRKPKGTEHFYGLLHAAKNHLVIRYTYTKFDDDEITQRVAEPFGLKEFNGRWYLISKDLKDGHTKTFGLDRIENLEITRKRFDKPKNLNANSLFRNCFGIINPTKGKIENIILSFDSLQGKYIKSFPLHETQEVLRENEKEVRIGLSLHVTHDLVMELLSYGETMIVVKPSSLKKTILSRASAILKQYA